jgi:hypothetical protein
MHNIGVIKSGREILLYLTIAPDKVIVYPASERRLILRNKQNKIVGL